MRLSPLAQRMASTSLDGFNLHHHALEARKNGADVILLTVGDPDMETPHAVKAAAVHAIEQGDTHYVDALGRLDLREAIARRHQKMSGMTTHADETVVCSGAQGALFTAAMAVFSPGDEVLVPDPAYLTYAPTLAAAGAVPVSVAAEARTLRLDMDAMQAAVTEKTKGLLVANPCNPVGHCLRSDETAAIAHLARRRDLHIISDEVYSSLTYNGTHVCLASVANERTVTLGSLSKTHAMTGWRLGWAVAPRPVIRAMGHLTSCVTHGIPGFIQAGAMEAFRNYDAFTAATRETYRKRRDILVEGLRAIPGLVALTPEAGMFVLMDIRGTGMTSATFSAQLYRKAGVAVLDGASFGKSTDGYVRLTLAASENDIRQACGRIASFVVGHVFA